MPFALTFSCGRICVPLDHRGFVPQSRRGRNGTYTADPTYRNEA